MNLDAVLRPSSWTLAEGVSAFEISSRIHYGAGSRPVPQEFSCANPEPDFLNSSARIRLP
jgi:hypothetical protein